MIDFDKRLEKEHLKTEKRNVRWCHNVANFIINHKNFLLALYVSNPFNTNNYALTRIRWDNIRCYNIINNMTFADLSEEEKKKFLDFYVLNGTLKKYEKDEENDILYLTIGDGTKINVKKISDYIENEDLKEILTSTKRLHECHHGSTIMAQIFEDCSDIVIGFAKLYNERNKLLHTWLEAETSEGKDVVIDYTLNAVIDKEAYYCLMHVQPINRFKSDLVRKDLSKIYKSEYKSVDGRCYLLYRDEMMNEIEKGEEKNK